MGTVALSNMTQGVTGSKRTVTADVTFSSSYATGGDAVPLGVLGLHQVDEVHVLGGTMVNNVATERSKVYTPPAHGLQVVFGGTTTAPKLKAYSGSTTEVANGVSLSASAPVRVEFRGS